MYIGFEYVPPNKAIAPTTVKAAAPPLMLASVTLWQKKKQTARSSL